MFGGVRNAAHPRLQYVDLGLLRAPTKVFARRRVAAPPSYAVSCNVLTRHGFCARDILDYGCGSVVSCVFYSRGFSRPGATTLRA